jgi:ribonuclease P protein component
LKKVYRIKKSNEIQQLIRRKTTVGNSYFILYYTKNHECINYRYALSVPKKFGNAVKRNLMKRRIREIIKVNSFLDEFDFFVVVKPKARDLDFSEIKKLVEKLFARANILRK